ncbi:MAG: CBS domain-containing protein, partial [Candidatus Cloacimonetes bacterium]|nr:CBS domain-containing protein [Candidatus Cloacimonadota bacterium]
DKIIEIINESGHSKIPIFKKNIDNIIGIIYAKDIILNLKKKSINSLLRPPIIVTENAKISKLLNQFKQQKIQIAIVVDEYGGTSGLITLEDVLEELVGEIRDEFDKEPALISQKNEFEYDVSGMFSIAELNDEFDLEIDAEYDNLADFLFDQFNKVPQKQESIIFKNKVKFTVSEVDGQRIQYAKMTLLNDEK